jgi:exonuclease SbcC
MPQLQKDFRVGENQMAIKKIKIKNFQSHKDSIIEPAEGLTVISGTSDGGKSVICRAVGWALTNRPTGFDFKSWFSDKKEPTKVLVEFDDGWVLREKSDKLNQYQVSSSKEPYKALRSGVPERVETISRMDSLNIQTQFDPYFMLQNTAGEVGRMFNEALGLEIIDSSLSVINTRERMTTNAVIWDKEKAADIADSLDVFEPLPILQKQLIKLIAERAHLDRMAEKILQIKTIKKGVADLNKKIAYCEEVVKHEKEMLELNELVKDLDKLHNESKELLKIIVAIKRVRHNEIEEKRKLSQAKKEYRALLEQHGICPVCFSPISDKDKLNHIMEHL